MLNSSEYESSEYEVASFLFLMADGIAYFVKLLKYYYLTGQQFI
jgi:hypothetical protein